MEAHRPESRLPNIPLPRSTVLVGGVEVEFRSLSRQEGLKVSTEFRGNPDAGETYLLACGLDISEAEAETWRASTHSEEAGKLVDAIVYLSGLAEPPDESDSPIPDESGSGSPAPKD